MRLKKELRSLGGLQFKMSIAVTLEKTLRFVSDDPKVKIPTQYLEQTIYFNSKVKTIVAEREIVEAVNRSVEEIVTHMEMWVGEGSGWTLKSIDGHYVSVAKYDPLRGSSYVELPKKLQHSMKGRINIQNEDNECFR